LDEVLSYKLCPFPPALFHSTHVFKKSDKPQLVHAVSEHARDGILDVVPVKEKHVLNGDSLLHRKLREKQKAIVQ